VRGLMFVYFFSYREDDQVLGAFLFINKIQETDYGQYMCSISNFDDQIVKQFTNITKPGELYYWLSVFGCLQLIVSTNKCNVPILYYMSIFKIWHKYSTGMANLLNTACPKLPFFLERVMKKILKILYFVIL